MTNYDQPTGNAGIVRMAIGWVQSRPGNYTNFDVYFVIVSNNPDTNVFGLGWSGTRSGVAVSGGGVDIPGPGVYNVAHWNYTVAHDSDGNLSAGARTFAFTMNGTGTIGLGGPTTVGPTTLSIPRIPKTPDAPGISVQSISGTSVTLKLTAPADNGGSPITGYQTQYSLNGGAFGGAKSGSSPTFTGLAPGSYRFRAFASNAIGTGAFSAPTSAITIFGGGKIKVNGAWKTLVPKIKVNGAMKPLVLKIKDNGTWKNLV